MRCKVFRSEKKSFHYVFITEDSEFADLPESLRQLFGEPEQIIQLDLDKTTKLANADIEIVRKQLAEDGYYLQLPPQISVEEIIAKRVT